MKSLANTFAATAILFAFAAPASALIDDELEKQFLEAATRIVNAADLAKKEAQVAEELQTPVVDDDRYRSFIDNEVIKPGF